MKKITLLFCVTLLSSMTAFAQFTFPADANVYVVPDNTTLVPVTVNDAFNSAGAPFGIYTEYTITVDWSISTGDAWSNETLLSVVTTAGATTAAGPTAGGAGSTAGTTLTFSGLLAGPYDPLTDGTLSLDLSRSYSSPDNWTNIIVTVSPSAPAPDCATGPPTPADGAVDVPVGSAVTFSWVAPTTGVTPTGYDLLIGAMADGSDFSLVGNYTTTTVDLTLNNNGQTLYWQVVAKNGASEATGCSIWSFTTVDPPPPPANDDCANATNIVPSATAAPVYLTGTTAGNTASGEVTDADMSCVSVTGYGSGRDSWFLIEVPASGEINIATQAAAGSNLDDTIITLFSGSCGTLTEVACNDDNPTAGDFFSLIELTGQTPGEMLLLRVQEYSPSASRNSQRGADDGEFEIAAYAADPTLGLEDVVFEGFKYFPNPVEGTLSLRAQDNIQAVSIYNMLGQEVLRTAPNGLQDELDMSGLNTGTYFVKVRINDVEGNFRIIKE